MLANARESVSPTKQLAYFNHVHGTLSQLIFYLLFCYESLPRTCNPARECEVRQQQGGKADTALTRGGVGERARRDAHINVHRIIFCSKTECVWHNIYIIVHSNS